MFGRELILALLMMAALPAVAAHDGSGRPGFANRELVVQARRLEDAARGIRHRLPSRAGRSPLVRDARLLAEAAGRFRQRAERGAPLPRLADSYRRVGARHRQLERRLREARHPAAGIRHPDVRRYGRDRGHRGVLREFDRAYARAGEALRRHAWRERTNRSRYASGERSPAAQSRHHRVRSEPGRDHH